jgi:hypothetical protein
MIDSRQQRTLKRIGAAVLSIAIHAPIVVAVLLARPTPAPPPPPPIFALAMFNLAPTPIKPEPAIAASSHAKPKPQQHEARPRAARPAEAPEEESPLAAGDSSGDVGLSDAELAGAASAGSGAAAGGGCDMAGRLQNALRKDPLVQSAVARAGAPGRAIMIWNGDWVQSRSEDGKGLAAVREAVIWEIAFAPKACSAQPMRGLVLLSMNEAPGGARLALGGGAWRWSDLLR